MRWPSNSLRCPEQIRGFGHVKLQHLEAVRKREAELLAQLRARRRRHSRPETWSTADRTWRL